MIGRASRGSLWVLGGIAVVLCVFWWSQITGSRVLSDSMATLQLGENLAHHGVLSIDAQPPIRPSMYREPVPGIIAAALIRIDDAWRGSAAQADYLEGERAQFLKRQNVFWLLLMVLGCAVLSFWVTRSVYPGLVGGVLAQAFFFYPAARAFGVDTLFSEIPAAAVLVVASLIYARAMIRGDVRWSALAGLAFGVLTLIKAAFLYVFVGLLVVAGLWCIARRTVAARRAVTMLLVMVLGFAALVAPWMWRNHALFGVAAVSDRAGLSLYTRVLKDQVSPAEFRGSFYAWTPSVVRPIVGELLEFGPQDLEPGGVLQHFKHARPPSPEYQRDQAAEDAGDPDAAMAYYVKGRAERVREAQRFAAQGHAHPWLAADQLLQQRALEYIRAHPWQHLKLTLPMLWRGALVIFPLLIVALAYALWRRRDELLLLCMPAFGLIMFYALFANFEERYGTPALPVALASGIMVLHDWARRWQSRARNRGSTAPC